MNSLRLLTAGESHGKAVVAILEGMPAGVPMDVARVNAELKKRQGGHGRGGRMKIEKDAIGILSGIRFGRTLGSPIAFEIRNLDYANWETKMAVEGAPPKGYEPVTLARPGHADLAGVLKFGHDDIRNVIERSSARETAARTAAGAIAKELLRAFDITWLAHVTHLGPVATRARNWIDPRVPPAFLRAVESSPVRCAHRSASGKMVAAIDAARKRGDTLGGIYEVVFFNVPPGLGSCMQWDRKLDARLAFGILSIHAQKGIEIGDGFSGAVLPGSRVHDEIFYSKSGGFHRRTNRAGGIEGGMTNGSPVVVRGAMKPISTLLKPLRSVDLKTRRATISRYERSDVCALPAASVVAEGVVAFVLADAFLEKFAGDHLKDVEAAVAHFKRRIR
ncbi:MAG: chorismate synthase [Candidatus Lindowbacteria bacterium RIFCSPLOWO2_12_FULL_62_27]|nr:MAG: chorismate synthase [Candidatus Lindowbacteria bacterium RIFCSPLOWO2_12_FULL_62_27]